MSHLIEQDSVIDNAAVLEARPAFLSDFFDKKGDAFCISPAQASHFAKHLARDFNPLHNVDAKRFCVPGDLLFALTLLECGLHSHMHFDFTGMVGRNAALVFEQRLCDQRPCEHKHALDTEQAADQSVIHIRDDQGKQYVTAEASGNSTRNVKTLEAFIRAYIAFSGKSFPDILIPLLAEQNVMINPDRPLVMYQSMTLSLHAFGVGNVVLRDLPPKLEQDGKRGNVVFPFEFVISSKSATDDLNEYVIGRGEKTMVVSGLRPYEAEKIQVLRDKYLSWKRAYAHSD